MDTATLPAPVASARLLDIPESLRYLDSLGLSKADAAKVWRSLVQAEAAQRKAGRLAGARGFFTEDIDAAAQQIRNAASQAKRDKALLTASRHCDDPEVQSLMRTLDSATDTLRSIEAKRGLYGVQWAERNTRRMATTQKATLRNLRTRIVARMVALGT